MLARLFLQELGNTNFFAAGRKSIHTEQEFDILLRSIHNERKAHRR